MTGFLATDETQITEIFTGGNGGNGEEKTFTRIGFPSPPLNGCPNIDVRSRELWCTN
jgi:hypothetical protein